MPEKITQNDYNEEPVTYCANCYSLKIGYEEFLGTECCMECGCSNTLQTNIDTWEKLYENRYGHKFITKSNDPRKSLYFKMPLDQLKEKLYDLANWREIIKALYPRFPGGYSRADSIILFFNMLAKDNRIDDLRLLLTKKSKH